MTHSSLTPFTRRSFLGYSVATVVLAPLATQLGCSSSPESGSQVSPDVASIKAFGQAFSAQNLAASQAHQRVIATIEVASQSFALDLTLADPPIEVSGPAADELSTTATAQLSWASLADDMLKAGVASAQWALTASKSHFVIPGSSPQGESVGEAKSAFLLTTTLLLGGLALTAYGAYKGTKQAVDTRAEPVKDKIQSASAEELSVINQSLGLPAGTPKDQTASHFQNLGIGKKLSGAKAVEQDLRNAEIDGVPGVNSVEASAINKSVSKSAVKLGETAVTTTVSAVTTATGGQGYSQAMEAAGAGKNLAAVVDFGITAVSAATEKPLQPLDILAGHLDVAVIDKDKQPLVIPKPTTGLSVDAAKQTVKDPNATGPEVDEAMSVIAYTTAMSNADGHQLSDNGDGTVTVMVPARVHIGTYDKPTNHITLKIPDMGPADVLIMAEGKVPKLIENVDTTESPVVGYENTDLEDYDPNAGGQYALLVIASPADPGPNQDVTVTAQISPATAGVPVNMSVSGTDGYSNSIETTTDASGRASLSIPGGAEGVTDTVTVTLPGNGVSQTMSYAF